MLAEKREPSHEYYVAILNDRSLNGPALVASAQGGMNIEEVAAKDPSAIHTFPIEFQKGLSKQEGVEIAKKLGIKDQQAAADIFVNLYRLFKDKDATQIEINPLAETKDGAVLWYGSFPSGVLLTFLLTSLLLNVKHGRKVRIR